jgi:outer membrane lipoprotein-sorting protein
MNVCNRIALVSIATAVAFTATPCQDAGGLTATQIMQKVDDVLYAPKDKKTKMRFVLVDKNGRESMRELEAMEKGADRRSMKFTVPADQKGIGFLSLPNDVMYVYLPAFGKTRRIASHVKNGKFAGTDLSYENLEAKRYSLTWDAKLVKTDVEFYYIEQTPKAGVETEYSKTKVQIRKDNFYPVRVEYYDKTGSIYKVMTRTGIEKFGNYWDARESVMEDVKANHKTKLLLLDAKFDNGLADDQFSERYLMQ